MKQRTVMPSPLDPSLDSVRSSDLLTAEDMQNEIPDLHQTDGLPNPQKREEVRQKAQSAIMPNKIDLVEDQIKKDIETAQKQKFEGIPKTPKDILKSLIAQGEYKETFKMYGQEWTLRALDQGDILISVDEVKDSLTSQSGRIMAVMFGTIVHSLDSINGISVYDWFEEIRISDYNNNPMEYNIAVRTALRKYLEAMPPAVIDSLYDKYLEVDSRRNEALDKLKNS